MTWHSLSLKINFERFTTRIKSLSRFFSSSFSRLLASIMYYSSLRLLLSFAVRTMSSSETSSRRSDSMLSSFASCAMSIMTRSAPSFQAWSTVSSPKILLLFLLIGTNRFILICRILSLSCELSSEAEFALSSKSSRLLVLLNSILMS